MDPVNIIVALNIIASLAANLGGAKKGLKSTFISTKESPKTYLQSIPLTLSLFTLTALILAVFKIGTIEYNDSLKLLRLAGLTVYLIFSWIQIWSFRTLGSNYSQKVLIFKDHKLVEKGPFKVVRHPQYLSQILLDLGGAIATLSYIIFPLAIIEIPLLIARAMLEEKLLSKNFKEAFNLYRQKTGFMIPFIG
jgi:protein-S-isoprenylcysteine O-methyltransferase Ste14